MGIVFTALEILQRFFIKKHNYIKFKLSLCLLYLFFKTISTLYFKTFMTSLGCL